MNLVMSALKKEMENVAFFHYSSVFHDGHPIGNGLIRPFHIIIQWYAQFAL